MLGDYPNVNIPKYLSEMEPQVNSYFTNLRTAIAKAMKL
jgi:hypothetical protein